MTSPEALSRVFDPRHPWALDVRQLQLQPEPLRGELAFPAPDRIGGEMIAVEPGAPVTLSVELFETEDGVAVSGSLRAPVAGQCSRCLERFAASTQASFREFFSFSPVEDDEEAPVAIGGKIDLEQSVIDAVVLGFPLSPVCAPDCRGICPECGVLLATVPADHGHEQIDPRWAGLRDRFGPPEPEPDEEAADQANRKEVGDK
ncbi:MAG: YceD family protein [Segniliparus sp.]|uniref:YceD family protein n=1 Tax=Segniliparus sp. TaxID=2804064 RepID=UPI003F2FA3E6